MTYEAEITENDFKQMCSHPFYSSLKPFDFEHYDELLKKIKGSFFRTKEDFTNYKKNMLKGVSTGQYDKPKIQINAKGMAICIDGLVRLLTMKVLGIDPVVEITNTANDISLDIQNHRFVSFKV